MMLLIETTQIVYSSDCFAPGLKNFESGEPYMALLSIGMPEEKSMNFLNCIKTLNGVVPDIVQSPHYNYDPYAQYLNIGAQQNHNKKIKNKRSE